MIPRAIETRATRIRLALVRSKLLFIVTTLLRQVMSFSFADDPRHNTYTRVHDAYREPRRLGLRDEYRRLGR